MVDDLSVSKVILFGGQTGTGCYLFGGCAINDTWNFVGGNWTNVTGTLTGTPPARWASGMAYDSGSGSVVLFGGGSSASASADLFGDTWSLSGSRWSAITSNPPASRYGESLAYDAADGYVLLFGGELLDGSYVNDTWVYSGGNWTQLFPHSAPSPRVHASMVYDAADDYILLFGGDQYDVSCACYLVQGDTWKFSGGQWTDLNGNLTTAPPPRTLSMMGYDVADREVVLFGGIGAATAANPRNIVLNDTWSFSGGQWTNLTSRLSVSPPSGFDASMAYDAADGYLIMFGGAGANTYSGLSASTWTFSGNLWTNVSAQLSLSPPGRYEAAMTYDGAAGYVLLFGGSTASACATSGACAANDTWAYSHGEWINLTSVGPGPAPQEEMAMTFNPQDGEVLLVDSVNGNPDTGRSAQWTWSYQIPLVANPIEPSNVTISSGDSLNLSARPSGGVPPYTYQWASGPYSNCTDDTVIPGQTAATLPIAPNQTAYYCYAVQDSATPKDTSSSPTDQIVVTNSRLISVSISPTPGFVQIGLPLTLAAISQCNIGTCPSQVNWTWSVNNTLVTILRTSGSNVTLTAGYEAGSVTVNLTGSLYGTTRSAQDVVTISTQPVEALSNLSITPSNPSVRTGASLVLEASLVCSPGPCPATGISLRWTLSNQTLGNLAPLSGNSTTFHAGSSPGSVIVTISIVWNGLPREANDTLFVIAPPAPPPLDHLGSEGTLLLVGAAVVLALVAVLLVRLRGRGKTTAATPASPQAGTGRIPPARPPFSAPPDPKEGSGSTPTPGGRHP